MNHYHFIGWTRATDPRGRVLRYHLRTTCNCITRFAGTWGGIKTRKPTCATHHPTSS